MKDQLNENLSDLQLVIESYRLTVASFLEKKPNFALMTVEIRSRELLVVWIAACIARSVIAKYDPISIITEYSSAINWKDLRHLVLSDKLAVDASMHVAAYLRKSDIVASQKQVFSLRSEDATMDFAKRYARLSPSIF